jgi:hypothetical protein
LHVNEIEAFLKKYGLPGPDDDQGAASFDSLGFEDVADANLESYR